MSKVKPGARLIVAKALITEFVEAAKIAEVDVAMDDRATGAELSKGRSARIPCAIPTPYYGFDVRVFTGDFVTTEAGTGFVHIAPGHGADDFELGMKHGVEVPQTVAADGSYYDHVRCSRESAGLHAPGQIGRRQQGGDPSARRQRQSARQRHLQHSYPHSWRSKAPIIFRNTPQWFISMSTDHVTATARQGAEGDRGDRVVPRRRREPHPLDDRAAPRLGASRASAPGACRSPCSSKENRPVAARPGGVRTHRRSLRAEGGGRLVSRSARALPRRPHDPADYEKVSDVIDVWFDSGSPTPTCSMTPRTSPAGWHPSQG
jgi:isoleucyl-tRNA synthetase